MAHPIEEESMRLLAERIELSHLAPGPRTVVERVIHATADLEFAASMVVDADAVDAGVAAVRRRCPVVVDVEMVRAGITGYETTCLLGDVDAAPGGYPTRTAQAIRRAAAAHPTGAVWVIGCAPTALTEVIDLTRSGALAPALVIALPVGFVGAAEAKEAARGLTGVPVISNIGEKGGSAVAAAAFNALRRLAGV